jgi:dipeptidyl aminopeptidase/acylaminoacyl peptidase
MKKVALVAIASAACIGFTVQVGTQARSFELADLARVVRLADPQISPDGRSIAIVVSRANLDEDRYDAEVTLVDVDSGKLRALTSDRRGVGQPRWSPSGDRLAFLASVGTGRDAHPQLFVLAMIGGEARRITNAANGVQQYAWSPDGSTIAVATADEVEKKTGTERFNDSFEVGNDDFLVTAAPTPTHVWLVPSDGGLRHAHGIPSESRDGAARRLTSGAWSLPVSFPPGAPSSPLAWSPDGKTIAIAKVPTPHSGDRSQSTVMLVEVSTGALKPLTGAMKFEGYPTFSPDGGQIAYWYPRDGDRANGNEIHLAPATGGAGRSLTGGIDRNLARSLWMPDGKSLLVGGNDGSRVSLWIQPLDGPARRIDIGSVSPASSFWVDVNVGKDGALAFVGSDPTRPAELYYMGSATAAPKRLTDLNHDVAALTMGRTEVIEWPCDTFTCNGLLTYPSQFSAGQKYPLVLVVHGGPRAASLENFSTQAQLMAAKGWVVFQPNYRGSDNLGSAFQRAIRNDAGAGPGRDVMAGVAVVKKRGFVDEARVAVSGWSYGGYMTTWLIGHYQGWRVAVSGAPVTDWLDQYNLSDGNVGAGMSFGGSPWTGTLIEAYREQSPITYASKIRTPTLVMQNTGDFRVTVSQGFKLYHALKDNGVETKFIAYPIPGHNAADPVRQRDVQRRWIDWIEQHFNDRSSSQ